MKVIATTPGTLKMVPSVRVDLRAQTEMLTFLVISHLATKFATAKWMSVESTVELLVEVNAAR